MWPRRSEKNHIYLDYPEQPGLNKWRGAATGDIRRSRGGLSFFVSGLRENEIIPLVLDATFDHGPAVDHEFPLLENGNGEE
jgi:hypothetical protein